jgi:hypothetical protein
MQANPAFASVTRTAAIEDDEALKEGIADLGRRLEKHGRSLADVDLAVWSDPWGETSPEAYVDRIGVLTEMGATWTHLRIDTSSFPAALDSLRSWGEVRRTLG